MLSISSKPIRNDHCGHDELVIPFSCKICNKCWVFVTGGRKGHCPYGGPFTGWELSHGATDGRTNDVEAADVADTIDADRGRIAAGAGE